MSDGGLPEPGWVPGNIPALLATVRTIEGLAREQGVESLAQPYLKAVSDRVPLLEEQAAAAGSPGDLAKVDPAEIFLIAARLHCASVIASPGGKNARTGEDQQAGNAASRKEKKVEQANLCAMFYEAKPGSDRACYKRVVKRWLEERGEIISRTRVRRAVEKFPPPPTP